MSDRAVSAIFTARDESSRVLTEWWKELAEDRGERARLRRAANPTEVAFCPSFHRLLGQLRGQGYKLGLDQTAALGAVVGLAAHVKFHADDASVARQMASPKRRGGKARVTGLRFRRLLTVSDRDELYLLLIRVIRLLDGSVNLVTLANSVFWWNERTKKDWAYEYYATAPSEP